MSSVKKPAGVRPPPKPSNLKFVRAAFAYQGQEADELSFSEGDLLYIIDDKSDIDWWKARCRGKEGLVPANFLRNDGDAAASDLFPMHDACRRGNLDSLEECLLNRVPVNSVDKAGNTPLHCTAHAGQADAMSRLLSVPQISVNVKNRLGDTPLHQAAFKGHAECIRRLRSSGASVDLSATNGDGKSAVDLAEEPETKAELQSWIRASDNRRSSQGGGRGDYDKEDYAGSDQEDDDDNED